MEEIKILVMALVSFLSQEQLPIVSKSAEIHIDRTNKQVSIKQYDLVSMAPYRDIAKAGLDSLIQTQNLRADMVPLRLVSKNFYEEEGKLNAVLYLQYDDLKDLRKMSFYVDEEGNLSYPYMDDFDYGLQTGSIDNRYVRFEKNQDVKFKMESKQEYPDGAYSLLEDWKAITASKYVDVTKDFSVKEFKRLRKFILKKGIGRSFRNIENNNPHYQFDDFGVYLASTTQGKLDHSEPLPAVAYDELVIWGDRQISLYLIDENSINTNPNLANDKVYVINSHNLDATTLKSYLKEFGDKL